MKGYKVVRAFRDKAGWKRESFLVPSIVIWSPGNTQWTKPAAVEYAPGAWACRADESFGPLCVFAGRRQAERFARNELASTAFRGDGPFLRRHCAEVWECDWEPAKEKFRLFKTFLYHPCLAAFPGGPETETAVVWANGHFQATVPVGTRLAERVRLTRLIFTV